MPRVLQARRANSETAMVVEDLLDMRNGGQHEAVTAIIRMVRDLEQSGRDSRFAKPLHGTPVWELKTRSRGGEKGGARVYFFWTRTGEAVLCGAEVKDADTAGPKLREATLSALAASRPR